MLGQWHPILLALAVTAAVAQRLLAGHTYNVSNAYDFRHGLAHGSEYSTLELQNSTHIHKLFCVQLDSQQSRFDHTVQQYRIPRSTRLWKLYLEPQGLDYWSLKHHLQRHHPPEFCLYHCAKRYPQHVSTFFQCTQYIVNVHEQCELPGGHWSLLTGGTLCNRAWNAAHLMVSRQDSTHRNVYKQSLLCAVQTSRCMRRLKSLGLDSFQGGPESNGVYYVLHATVRPLSKPSITHLTPFCCLTLNHAL